MTRNLKKLKKILNKRRSVEQWENILSALAMLHMHTKYFQVIYKRHESPKNRSAIILYIMGTIIRCIYFIEPNPCCFRYGLGARAIPCCLETITCDEHDKLVEDSKTNPIVGGSFGKHKTCPIDAAEAHLLVSG